MSSSRAVEERLSSVEPESMHGEFEAFAVVKTPQVAHDVVAFVAVVA